MTYEVTKRDGTLVSFDIDKIMSAIEKSFRSLDRAIDRQIIELLALRTTADFEKKVVDGRISVEDIQDSVETVLSLAGYADVAKAYILYRKQRERVRQISAEEAGYSAFVKSYLEDPEQNAQEENDTLFSVGGLIYSYAGNMTRNYWLNSVYDDQITRAHKEGWFHIHNLDMLAPVSAGWDIGRLIEGGFSLPHQVHSRPPRHLDALCSQLADFLAVMQQEWAGAQSLAHFDTYLAPFIRKDSLTDEEISSALETFVFSVNAPTRWGTQSPFSNITFDGTVPAEWSDKPVIGMENLTYGECQPEMDRLRKIFFKIMAQGDGQSRGFPFPIPVVRSAYDVDELYEAASRYGSPVFARNTSPMEGFFSYEAGKCSAGAVTLNLPRIAYKSDNENDFFSRLDEYLELAIRTLKTKESIIRHLFASGLYPCTKSYNGSLGEVWNSIGIVGLNEAAENAKWIKADLLDEKAVKWGGKVLKHIRSRLDREANFNLYAAPAEGVSSRLAALDKEKYPDIITAGDGSVPYYTNSSMVANDRTDDLFEEVLIQQKLQPYFNGGSFFSIPFARKAESEELKLITKRLLERTNLPVFAFTPVYEVPGEKDETWIRVSGYYRPLSDVNEGKLQEFRDRKNFQL